MSAADEHGMSAAAWRSYISIHRPGKNGLNNNKLKNKNMKMNKNLKIELLEAWQGRHETQRAKCCTTVVSNLNLGHSSPNFESGWGTTSYLLRVPRISASFWCKTAPDVIVFEKQYRLAVWSKNIRSRALG